MQSPISLKRAFRTISSMLALGALAYPLRAQYNAGLQGDNPTNPTELQSAYFKNVSEHYNFRFGTNKPSLPSSALYYLALEEHNQGRVDAASKNLQEVTARFPRSRDAHYGLGFSLYQEHQYGQARTGYKTLQAIDPDDLATHYVDSIIYRRPEMKAKATVESAASADQKDDLTASTCALRFLRAHPEITSESIPVHPHTDRTGQVSVTAGVSGR